MIYFYLSYLYLLCMAYIYHIRSEIVTPAGAIFCSVLRIKLERSLCDHVNLRTMEIILQLQAKRKKYRNRQTLEIHLETADSAYRILVPPHLSTFPSNPLT